MNFSKSKPRDNSMYNINEGNRLDWKPDYFLDKLKKIDSIMDTHATRNEGTGKRDSIRLSKLIQDNSSNHYQFNTTEQSRQKSDSLTRGSLTQHHHPSSDRSTVN